MKSVSVHIAVLAVGKDAGPTQAVTELASAAGHIIAGRATVSDNEGSIRAQLLRWIEDPNIDVVIVSGGAESDHTSSALKPLVTSVLPGFTDLFRYLAFQEIGASAMLSNAEAAQCGSTFVFVLPATATAVRAAMDKLILPQLDPRTTPKNLVMSMPRLRAHGEDAIPQPIVQEKTAGGSGLTPKAPASQPVRRERARTGANVIARKQDPALDPPTRPIDVARLEEQIALSETSQTDATRRVDLSTLPEVAPGGDDTLDAELVGDDTLTTTRPAPDPTTPRRVAQPTPLGLGVVAGGASTRKAPTDPPPVPSSARRMRTEPAAVVPPATRPAPAPTPALTSRGSGGVSSRAKRPSGEGVRGRAKPGSQAPRPGPPSEPPPTPRPRIPSEPPPAPRPRLPSEPPPAPPPRVASEPSVPTTKRSPSTPPPPSPAASARQPPPRPPTAPSVEAAGPSTGPSTGDPPKRPPTLPPPRAAEPDIGALVAPPLARASGELPQGMFSDPEKKSGNKLGWFLALAGTGGLGFAAVVFLLPMLQQRGGAAAPATPPPVVATATLDAAGPDELPGEPAGEPAPAEVRGSASPEVTPLTSPPPPTAQPSPRTRPATPTTSPRPGTGRVTGATGVTVVAGGSGTTSAPEDPAADDEPPVSPPATDGCDEVACVLTKYEKPCCARFKPADSDLKPRTGGGLPEELDKAMVRAGVDRVKPRVVACGEKSQVKGTVRIAVKVTPEGNVESASVTEAPSTELGECVAAALRKATFGASVQGGGFTYPFVF